MNGKYSKWGVVVIVWFLVLGASMISCTRTTPNHGRKLLVLELVKGILGGLPIQQGGLLGGLGGGSQTNVQQAGGLP